MLSNSGTPEHLKADEELSVILAEQNDENVHWVEIANFVSQFSLNLQSWKRQLCPGLERFVLNSITAGQ